MKTFLKNNLIIVTGGILYCFIEVLYRGYTHISMFIVGGLCFWLIGGINHFSGKNPGLLWQSLLGGVIITVLELVTGVIVNLWLELEVWDYSSVPFNFLGQICLPYSLIWIGLSGVIVFSEDYLRHFLFGEERPRYRII